MESARGQQTTPEEEEKKYDIDRLPEDYQEDYYNLDTDEQKEMFKNKMISMGYWGK